MMSKTFTFHQLQNEQREWTTRNFPHQTDLEPILGLIEEFGEREQALTVDEELDAIGDIIIFGAAACSRFGFELPMLMSEAESAAANGGSLTRAAAPGQLLRMLGKLAHHTLKRHQGIRGPLDERTQSIRESLVGLFEVVVRRAQVHKKTVLEVSEEVWSRVQKREWRSFT